MCVEQGIRTSPNTFSQALFIQARSASKGMRVALWDWVADSSRLRFGLGWKGGREMSPDPFFKRLTPFLVPKVGSPAHTAMEDLR